MEIQAAPLMMLGEEPPPTSRMAVTVFKVGSIRVSVDTPQLDIQTASLPTAIPPQGVASVGMAIDVWTALVT